MSLLNKMRTVPATRRGRAAEFPGARPLRAAVTAFFALDGFVFAGWVVRIPAVKDQTGAGSGALGLALLGLSAGAVATMAVTGALCRRYGSRPMTVASAVLLSLSVALPAQTHSALGLGLVLLVFGAAYGGVNVAMNSAAVDLVAASRRPIMSSFHAAFSLGGMVGAGLGGVVAGRLSAAHHLLSLAVIALVVTALAGRALLAAPADGEATARARTPAAGRPAATDSRRGPAAESGRPRAAGRPSPRTRWSVVVSGVIALCSSYGEGAMADWGALHLKDDLHASSGVAAAGYALFALAMTAGRLSGAVVLLRLGQARALTSGGAVAAVGMLVGSLAPVLWLTLLGFAVTGAGLSLIFPVAIGRAGALTGPSGVATASTLGYCGMLVGPPTIGLLADVTSLPTALTTVAALAGVAALIAHLTGGWSGAHTHPPAGANRRSAERPAPSATERAAPGRRHGTDRPSAPEGPGPDA